jgi:[acyl-carrier-protein] S-malonyltransferase
LLPVSAPFHTCLMRPVAEQLAELVNSVSFRSPKIPIVHNVHAQTEMVPDRIKRLMLEQIHRPVKWVSCVKVLHRNGAQAIIECGPGRVLCGLTKRINRTISPLSSDNSDSFSMALAKFGGVI